MKHCVPLLWDLGEHLVKEDVEVAGGNGPRLGQLVSMA